MSFHPEFYPKKGVIVELRNEKRTFVGVDKYIATRIEDGSRVKKILNQKDDTFVYLVPYNITFAIGAQTYNLDVLIEATGGVTDYKRAYVDFTKY